MTRLTRLTGGSLAGLLIVLLMAVPSAQGLEIKFDFNTLADGASNGTVQTYMRNLITATPGAPGGASVTVTGAAGEKNYTGDNHVVGPVSGSSVYSETLGTSDGGVHHSGSPDAFLINSGSTTITMTFNFAIHSVKFDYEIFPDGTCLNSSCGAVNWPDFTFEANDVVQIGFPKLGIVPGASGTFFHSPNSGIVNNEPTPQFLGQSALFVFPGAGVTKLEFIDWPKTIGIDNLYIDPPTITTQQNVVPEPGSLTLMLAGLIGLAALSGFTRKRRI